MSQTTRPLAALLASAMFLILWVPTLTGPAQAQTVRPVVLLELA
jgi:hypothetical protein